MDLPNNITLICNLSGDVLQKDENVDVKTIFEIISEDEITQFHEYLKSVFNEGKFVNMYKVKLVNGFNYHMNLQIFNNKITFIFCKMLDTNSSYDCFWMDSAYRYEYYLRRAKHIMSSLSNLIDNLFYKNRTDIDDILKDLCAALKFQSAMLLFRNGKDHIIYCNDELCQYKCKHIDDTITKDRFLDENYSKNVEVEVSDILIIKKYENTYFCKYLNNSNNCNKKVYVLKLMFGPKIIGYLEVIGHTYINFTPVELKLFQSLSSILAYVINNKREQSEIEDYIKEKLIPIQ